MTLTKNTAKLRQEVAAHVAADAVVQGIYWDAEDQHGCFIGCLAKSNDPAINEETYGLPVMLQRIAENIFESLSPDEAKAFFAALPDAVAKNGKDLTRVSWQFLAAELRSLPEQSVEFQAVIDPVIAGMDLLASGQKWPEAIAAAAADGTDVRIANDAVWAAANAAQAAQAAPDAQGADAAWAATYVARAAARAADAARAVADAAARAAVRTVEADDAVWPAADAAWAATRLRQRDLLLRLIAEAPVVENTNDTH